MRKVHSCVRWCVGGRGGGLAVNGCSYREYAAAAMSLSKSEGERGERERRLSMHVTHQLSPSSSFCFISPSVPVCTAFDCKEGGREGRKWQKIRNEGRKRKKKEKKK